MERPTFKLPGSASSDPSMQAANTKKKRRFQHTVKPLLQPHLNRTTPSRGYRNIQPHGVLIEVLRYIQHNVFCSVLLTAFLPDSFVSFYLRWDPSCFFSWAFGGKENDPCSCCFLMCPIQYHSGKRVSDSYRPPQARAEPEQWIPAAFFPGFLEARRMIPSQTSVSYETGRSCAPIVENRDITALMYEKQ